MTRSSREPLETDPLWYKDAIIYEIHVKSFFDSNNDGVGDFLGLIQKLDYLQDLGVTALWLLPFYPSPLRDDGYDIADYRGVHPDYGTLKDFRRFVKEAHTRGMRVITELVVNHTSDQHPWFQASRKAPPGSPKRDFYVWSDTDKKYEDARIIFTDSERSNWSWDAEAKAYYWHRFFYHQPDLNYDNPHVRREVIRVMLFWLEMGVDGLRLDAVPYLIEREGTNCENLHETHVVLKEMRKALDRHFSDRMLLAEANQWPSDVRPYFGDGDECHMAFHFPLMPRIFMALRQEDRHPISEILAQTPDIPESCQWALFLRNHDELTLEMVTDEERDYMYHEYARDLRMRINIGIRRRLAPLVENSRRRLELLNSLLLSFPGTPVIYYGDEIGMGDNVFLGDRNGVRTPMQWTGDRNAGFSKADPARLFSQVIMDPVYGYQGLNVEAEERDLSSLLNWTKRMIALRKRHRVFSRGTMEVLTPANRKVLAYLRRFEGDIILCVANLSRFVQPCELDLSFLNGMVPVEMLGQVEFPPIGELPYFVTLGPHTFYWFTLHPARVGAGVAYSATAPAKEEPLLAFAFYGAPESLLEGEGRKALEKLLPRYLPRQRWFGAKARKIASVRISDWSAAPGARNKSFLTVLEIRFTDGTDDLYNFPLTVVVGEEARQIRESRSNGFIAELQGGEEPAVIIDAMVDDEFCSGLLKSIESSGALRTRQGSIQAFPTRLFEEARGAEADLAIIHPSLEQSNTSVFYDKRLILKLFRRLQPGPNPDFEIGQFLTEKTRFDRVPITAGGIEYRREGMESTTLAMIQGMVGNQGDGWTNTLDELSRYFEVAAVQADAPGEDGAEAKASFLQLTEKEPKGSIAEMMHVSMNMAATLGRRTGEMHMALASEAKDPAFKPEPLSAQDFSDTTEEMKKYATSVLVSLEANLKRLPEEIRDMGYGVIAQRKQLLKVMSPPKGLKLAGGRIRVHGDYHLGQVLLTENDFVILDFEGEPSRSLAERRSKQSPFKDVAGMLRSYSYAAYAGLFAYASTRPEDKERLEVWANQWERWSCAAFLKNYRQAVQGTPFWPEDPAVQEALLAIFLMDKAVYEVNYELNNRPGWTEIPLRGLLALL